MAGSRLHLRRARLGAVAITLGAGMATFPAALALPAAPDANPCLGPQAQTLLCPDFEISPPSQLRFQRTRAGRLLLRATSSLNNVGRGPVELVGHRTGPKTMGALQRIRRLGGGWLTVKTGARLGFKAIPGQYRYWKFRDAARFELWSLDPRGVPAHRVRVGPKHYYCLRDLRRTLPSRRSPRSAHYPACSQDRAARSVSLGTSPGWSDIYPATYYEQWIDVTSLHGRFAYVMIADPANGVFESNESNNTAQTLVTIR